MSKKTDNNDKSVVKGNSGYDEPDWVKESLDTPTSDMMDNIVPPPEDDDFEAYSENYEHIHKPEAKAVTVHKGFSFDENIQELDYIPLPAITFSSGNGFFETSDGQPCKTVECVVIGYSSQRSYWDKPFDPVNQPESKSPVCASGDCVSAWPDSREVQSKTGLCKDCLLSQWGAVIPGTRKKTPPLCRERKILLVYTPNSVLPSIVTLPPTGLKVFKKFLEGRIAVKKLYQLSPVIFSSQKTPSGYHEITITPTNSYISDPDKIDELVQMKERFLPGLKLLNKASGEIEVQ